MVFPWLVGVWGEAESLLRNSKTSAATFYGRYADSFHGLTEGRITVCLRRFIFLLLIPLSCHGDMQRAQIQAALLHSSSLLSACL